MANKDYVKLKISGLSELNEKLLMLDRDIRGKAARQAAKQALTPNFQEIKQNAPELSGGLKASVRWSSTSAPARLEKLGKNAFMVTSINVGYGKRNRERGGYQALQIEYGQNDRGVKARPFIRPAIRGKEKPVFMRFRRTLRLSIEKFAKTQSRRNKRK